LEAAALAPADPLNDDLRDAIQHDPSDDLTPPKIYADDDVPDSLRAALARFGLDTTIKEKLEAVEQPYLRSDAHSRGLWPDFVFPLADPEYPQQAPLGINPAIPDTVEALEAFAAAMEAFTAVLLLALPAESAGPEPEIPTAVLKPVDPLNAVFRIRCVYERPNCGPLHEDVVSEATEPFDLASFFDPDAPARPIRIGLPLDTTPAGLRKFDKNTAFVMSDILCGQLARFQNITFVDLIRSVLPWPLHKDLSVPDSGPCVDGTVCSLSIPIITLCALILLIIIVTLLNIVFGWLPFFKICFPIPGLKGKQT
jgi:hypothetical protein